MRVMVIVKATADATAGPVPDGRSTDMRQFNEALVKAGVTLAAEGLRAGSQGARITFDGGRPIVLDVPFNDTNDLIVGLWLWQVKSLDEAIEWAKRGPFENGTEIEIRQVFEAEEFADQLTRGLGRPESRPGLAAR
jgi:hypothetical protein